MRVGSKVSFEACSEGIKIKTHLYKDEDLFFFLTEALLALSTNGGESEVIVMCLSVLNELSSAHNEGSRSDESKEYIC